VRRVVPFAILAGCLGVGVLPALAADRTVFASGTRWVPSEFAVTPGDQVTWSNRTGVTHNLYVEGAKVVEDSDADWTYTAAYPARASAYTFACTVHPGMAGRFYVNATGTVPTPSPTASPTATPTPTPAPPAPTAAPAPAPATTPAPTTPAVTSFRVRATRSRFCARRSASCRRPGVFLLVELRASEPVPVRGTLRRGARRVRGVSLLARPGRRRVRLPGRRLKAGRYVLTLRAGDITRRVRFRVRGG
jgi:hypothetical protein